MKDLTSRFSRWMLPAVLLFAAGCAAIRTPAKEAQNLFDRGDAYARQGDNDLAIAYYNRGLELMPTFAWGYVSRGNVHRQKGDYDHAISDYTKAVELIPRFALAYLSRGIAYSLKGDYDRAIADCTKTLGLEPKNGLAHYSRALAYYAIGDYPRSRYLQIPMVDPARISDQRILGSGAFVESVLKETDSRTIRLNALKKAQQRSERVIVGICLNCVRLC